MTSIEAGFLCLALWFVPGALGAVVVASVHSQRDAGLEDVRSWVRDCVLCGPAGLVIGLLIWLENRTA